MTDTPTHFAVISEMIFSRNFKPECVVNTIFLKNILNIAELWGPSSRPLSTAGGWGLFS